MADDEVVKVTRLTRWQRIGMAALLLLCAGVIGGAIFIWSGYYNVGANRAHLDVTTWLLTIVRDQSIRAYSEDITVPPLDAEMAALGAEHYRTSCVDCHGSPGEAVGPVYEAMLPAPPDLLTSKEDYDSSGLYWIVASGLKYTGMPAWPAEGRSDEVWSMVAYLESLRPNPAASRDTTASAPTVGSCVRCHGTADTAPVSSLVPRLDILDPEYMARAMAEYRAGTRPSGFMEPVAYHLSAEEAEALVDYYTGLDQPDRDMTASPDLIARGRLIAEEGAADAQVPACNACHGAERGPQFPNLAGQSKRYMETQLKLWAAGQRGGTGYGAIMAVVGARLSPEQIEAASAYYASLEPAPSDSEPEP